MTQSHDANPDLLILTFPRGGSLSRWEQFGVLDREVRFIEGIGSRIGRVLCVSTAGTDERRIAEAMTEQTGFRIDAISQSEPDPVLGPKRTLEQRVLAYAEGVGRVVIQTIQFDDDGVAERIIKPLRRAGIAVGLVARGSFIESRVLAASRGPQHFSTLAVSENEKRIFSRAQVVSGTSHTMMDELCWKHGVDPARTSVINQPVVMPENPDRLNTTRCDNRILTAGRYSDGCTTIRLAIDAVGMLPEKQRQNLILEVIGEGPDGVDLPAYAGAAGVNAEFRRGVSHPQLIASLARAAMFLQPENARRQSVVVLEAMAMGCPVVVSDIPEYNGLIENGTSGIRVTQDPRAFAFATDCLMSDSGFRSMMGEAAHTRAAAECHLDLVVKTLLANYRTALKNAPQRGEDPVRRAS